MFSQLSATAILKLIGVLCGSKMPTYARPHRDAWPLSPKRRPYPQHAWGLLHATPHMAGTLRHVFSSVGRAGMHGSDDAVDRKAVV